MQKIHLLILFYCGFVAHIKAQSPLCPSAPTQFCCEYVSEVKINGSTTTGATGFSGPGYFDFTGNSLGILTAGNTYPVSVTVKTNSTYQEFVKIWFDFNGNGNLTDLGELVFDQVSTYNGSHVFSGEVMVPKNAYNGDVYIRVVMTYANSPTLCGSYAYGNTMDYKASIIGGVESRNLTVSITGTGGNTGTVISSPIGIDTSNGFDSSNFAINQNVILTATPSSGSNFLGWSGDATGATNPLSVTMDKSKTVVANFGSLGVANPLNITSITTLNSITIPSNNAKVIDPSIAVNYPNNINGFKVIISEGKQNGDILAYTGTLPTGITSTGFDQFTGVLTFTGETSATDWQTLLRTVTFNNITKGAGTRSITFSAGNLESFKNGHFYQYISTPTTWTDAKAAAASKNYLSYQGYLTTITSKSENDFIQQIFKSNSWIGASDEFSQINDAIGTSTYANQSASEGKWYWITGPEAGVQISSTNAPPTPVNGAFNFWNPQAPDDPNSSEQYAAEFYSSNTGQWDDLPNTPVGYIIEYGGLTTDIVQTPSYTMTMNVSLDTDSDGDGVTDSQELIDSTDPADSCDFKVTSQNSAQSIEWNNADCDSDGVPNSQESNDGTNPLSADTDGDGVTDGKEKTDNTDPKDLCKLIISSQTLTPSVDWNSADCDGDGSNNADELAAGTNPLIPNNGSAPSNLIYGNLELPINVPIQIVIPSVNASPAPTFSISSPLPAGLIFDPATGTISGTPTVLLSTTEFTVTATNSLGSTSQTFTIHIYDNVNPTIIAPPDINVTTTSQCTASEVILGTPETSDNDVVASIINNAPSVFPLGNTNVTWTATDASGNTSTDTQIVTVTDNIAPNIVPKNISVPLESNGQISVSTDKLYTEATDNCSVATINASKLIFNCDDVGENIVVIKATDGSGNSTEANVIVTVTAFANICDKVNLYASEAVTPNDDGINDTWIIYNIENHPGTIVRVFNRWGSQVFYSSDYKNDWNGSYQNKDTLPESTSYLYQIDSDGDGSIDNEGWLYITR